MLYPADRAGATGARVQLDGALRPARGERVSVRVRLVRVGVAVQLVTAASAPMPALWTLHNTTENNNKSFLFILLKKKKIRMGRPYITQAYIYIQF